MGSQISWLVPAALVALCALVWHTWARPRTDALRASIVVWGGWLIVTGVVLSFASGIIHPYYTVALAPAIAALVGMAVVLMWRERRRDEARWALAAIVAAGAVWSYVLLGRSTWHSELRWYVLSAGLAAVVAITVKQWARAAIVAPLVALALLIAPSAYALQTAATAHTGAIPTAGLATTSGGFGGGPGGGPGGVARQPGTGSFTPPNAQAGGGNFAPPNAQNGLRANGSPGGASGLGGAGAVSSALASALKSGNYAWSAATTSDNEAATLELASGTPVMSLGGYNGTDPAISLDAFKNLVAAGKVHYYIADGQGFIGSTAADTSTAYAIQQWVEATFSAQTIGGTTVYDLTTGG
jgi:4-amino-4-deoxy-L-arabinose transferase-like glycosyltransferase